MKSLELSSFERVYLEWVDLNTLTNNPHFQLRMIFCKISECKKFFFFRTLMFQSLYESNLSKFIFLSLNNSKVIIQN